MHKMNLFNEIIVVDRSALMRAVNSGDTFGITCRGEVTFEPEGEILIYRGRVEPAQVSALAPKPQPSLAQMLGGELQIVEDDERILIKAARAWQSILALNLAHASYDDSSTDGLSEFMDDDLEQIGWHADEFEIGYREIAEELEAHCEGILLCIEQDDPYRFSGLGFIFDHDCARRRAFEYAKSRIERLVAEEEEYAPRRMTADELEAARFFGVVA